MTNYENVGVARDIPTGRRPELSPVEQPFGGKSLDMEKLAKDEERRANYAKALVAAGLTGTIGYAAFQILRSVISR